MRVMNITLSLDEKLVKEVRKIAVERDWPMLTFTNGVPLRSRLAGLKPERPALLHRRLEIADTTRGGVPGVDVKKMLHANCKALYRLDHVPDMLP